MAALSFQWARVQGDAPLPLRRGAWYRILRLTSMEATLNVRGKPLPVPRGQLQLSAEPVLQWAVVPAPRSSARFPSTWGPRYAVCPSCRERAPLVDHPNSMRCHRCNNLFDVAWTSTPPGKA